MLETATYGTPSDHANLVVVHGLFGSGRNWSSIAKRLSADRQVITVDMRNHGNSFHATDNSYPAMAEDLVEVISAYGGRADVLGHSMGGKAAMCLALNNPESVNRLVVADIAPVAYSHTQMHYITAMQGMDLSGITRRRDADSRLGTLVEDPGVRAFLLQSLVISENGNRWLLNLDVLADQMPLILGFPETVTHFDGPTLFLTGGKSDYVLPEFRSRILDLFPNARHRSIPEAGHWLHADKPSQFIAAVTEFL